MAVSFRNRVKVNIPRVDPQSYIFLTAGNYKSGKTRWWKEFIEYFYPNDPDAGLLVAWESGYKSWKLNSFIDLTEYKKEEEVKPGGKVKVKSDLEIDADKWQYFKKEVVTGLVQESREGRTSKVVGFDTVDRMIDCASASIIVEANIKYPGAKFGSIQEMSESKTYKENVWNNLYEELKRPVDTLRAAGYGLAFLAWTKEKTTETIDGLKYNSIELMMNATCRKVFQSQADLICCLHNEVTALDKEGNALEKNLESKGGKEIATKFHESQTYMYFRESNYIGIAGGRFIHLPEKAPYGINTYVQVFEEAVKGQLDGTESIEDIRKAEIEAREEKAQQFSENHMNEVTAEENSKPEVTASEVISQIAALLDGLGNDVKLNVIAPIFDQTLKNRVYTKVTDVEALQKAAAEIQNALNK